MIVFQFFYSVLIWLYIVFIFVSHFLVSNILRWFFKDRQWGSMKTAKPFIWGLFNFFGLKVTYSGFENLPKDGAYIIAANHQSNFDILALMHVLPFKFAFFAKKQLKWVPILGLDILQQGHFLVDRENPRVAHHQLEVVKKKALAGHKVLIFPEGTRTKTGKIAPFKRGLFQLAVQTGLPILPVVIQGSYDIFPKKSFFLRPGHIQISFLPLLPVKKATTKAEEKPFSVVLSDQVHELMVGVEERLASEKT